MKIITLKSFDEKYAGLPERLKKKVDKQLFYLTTNLQHPSLHAKKYNESENIWQARIDDRYRFYFRIENNAYVIISIKTHKD